MKIAVVTGANSGIGYETALALAEKKYHVVLLCRSQQKGEVACQTIKQESGNEHVTLISSDLASLESVRIAAERIAKEFPVIDVLVNNAGVFMLKKEYTKDGFEKMIGVNYVGHFYFTQKLLPSLERAEAARIVIVSSMAYKMVRFQLSDLWPDSRFSFAGNYGRSKLMNLLFAKELAVRLADTSITVNALHPGAVSTSMGVNRKTGFGRSVHTLLRPFFKTPVEGAATSVYLATSKEIEGISGNFYVNCQPVAIKGIATDNTIASRLYTETTTWLDEQHFN